MLIIIRLSFRDSQRRIFFAEVAVVQCCFTFTENTETIRDWEPRTATATFTQLLNSVVVVSTPDAYIGVLLTNTGPTSSYDTT